MRVAVCETHLDLARRAAEIVVERGRSAIASRGSFHVVLSGGHTPEETYQYLVGIDQGMALDWARVHLYWGDERLVPHDDADSNYSVAFRSLISQINIPEENVNAVDVSTGTAAEAAQRYEAHLKTLKLLGRMGAYPRFDLILLGIGDDGHTASLFPGHQEALDSADWAVGTSPGALPPPVDRVTLTLPVLCRAADVLFLASGTGKAEVVRRILEDEPPVHSAPAAGVRPLSGAVTWLLDRLSSARLSSLPT